MENFWSHQWNETVLSEYYFKQLLMVQNAHPELGIDKITSTFGTTANPYDVIILVEILIW